MTPNDFISGDGGSMLVLQGSITPRWQGAHDWDNSLMNGGTIETDYDVICQGKDTGYALKRYDRDMLVLDDSEWGAYIFALPSGSFAVVQQYVGGDNVFSIVERIGQRHPSKSFTMDVQDSFLRLLVGAEDGNGQKYGHKDVLVTPGKKNCDVFSSRDELVVIINLA